MKKILAFFILALTWMLSPTATIAQKKGDPLFQAPLGIAAYTFRDQWKNGVPETLDIIQKMGFKEYEGGVPQGVDPLDPKLLSKCGGTSYVVAERQGLVWVWGEPLNFSEADP